MCTHIIIYNNIWFNRKKYIFKTFKTQNNFLISNIWNKSRFFMIHIFEMNKSISVYWCIYVNWNDYMTMHVSGAFFTMFTYACVCISSATKCLCYLMKPYKAVLILLRDRMKPFVSSKRMFWDLSIDTVLTVTCSRCNRRSLSSSTDIYQENRLAPDCWYYPYTINYTTCNYIFCIFYGFGCNKVENCYRTILLHCAVKIYLRNTLVINYILLIIYIRICRMLSVINASKSS